MPPKGMQDYVHERHKVDGIHANYPPGGNEAFDDCKAAVPQLPNSGAQRSGGRQQLSTQVKKEKKASEPARRVTNEHVPYFEDTDASDAVKTSTSTSTKRTNTEPGIARQYRLATHPRLVAGSESSGSPDGSDDDRALSDDLPDIGLHDGRKQVTLDHKQRALMDKVHHQKVGHTQVPFKHVNDDDYPSTTSGRPSVSDASEAVKVEPQKQIAAVAQPSQGRQRSDPKPVKTQRLAPPQQLATLEQQPRAMLTSHGLFEAPGQGDDVLGEVQTGFVYGKAQPHKSQPTRAAPPTAPAGRVTPVMGPPIAATQQHGASVKHTSRPDVQPSRPEPRQASHQTQNAPPGNIAAPHKHRKDESQRRLVSRTTTPVQQHCVQTAPEPDPLSPQFRQGEQHGYPEQNQSEDEDVLEEKKLDYEASELYDMEFQALKQTKFDVDPNAKAFTFPDDLPANTLTERLFSMSQCEPEYQAAFMKTLDIDQWEDAGGWFLDKFGELVTKFRTARREKREAAHCFEVEVMKRHEAVSKKRKLTEAAMSEMKASGAQVLQGTPKRLRKAT